TLSAVASGDSFADWLAFASSGDTSGHYAGHLFTGPTELAAFMGQDPRWHRCEITKLSETIFQRPGLPTLDQASVIRSLEKFYLTNMNLKAALGEIVKSKDYGYGEVTPKARGAYATDFSGIRFLTRKQWEGILKQLSISAGKLGVPKELDPGLQETLTSADGMPSGAYWHATERIARQAATAIVSDELRDDYSAKARKVFVHI